MRRYTPAARRNRRTPFRIFVAQSLCASLKRSRQIWHSINYRCKPIFIVIRARKQIGRYSIVLIGAGICFFNTIDMSRPPADPSRGMPHVAPKSTPLQAGNSSKMSASEETNGRQPDSRRTTHTQLRRRSELGNLFFRTSLRIKYWAL